MVCKVLNKRPGWVPFKGCTIQMVLIHAIQKHDAVLERPLYHQNATIGVNCWCESRFLISRGRKCALRDVICMAWLLIRGVSLRNQHLTMGKVVM